MVEWLCYKQQASKGLVYHPLGLQMEGLSRPLYSNPQSLTSL